jgi:hypothetical protein
MQFIEKFSFFRGINITTFQTLSMKYLTIILLFSFVSLQAMAQSVSISPVSEHSGFSQSEFPLYNGSLSVTSTQLRIGSTDIFQPSVWARSTSGKKVGVLKPVTSLKLFQYDYQGNKLFEKELEFFDSSDNTLNIYQFDDGRAVARDNVANFTFFASDGAIVHSVSNSSQSPDGERESRLASDSKGSTFVLYNPVISYGGTTGSRARVVFKKEDSEIFYRSESREIKQVKVSRSGSFITMLTSGGGEDSAHIFDRFGNNIFELELADGQQGLSLSENGEFLTVYSRGRVQVFNTLSGETVGSTSPRNPVLFAEYVPEDEVILILAGSYSGNSISSPVMTAVSVSQRQIANRDIGFSLSAIDLDQIDVIRSGAGQFYMRGLNKELNISTQF